MADPQRALGVLQRIDALGVALSIDDFGTGYSSMAYLKHLPVDELKIDQSFVRGMHTEQKDEHLVRSLIELGHNLGLKVLAEGVETGESLAQLRDFGCDSAQGYFVAKPMPGSELVSWAADNESRRSHGELSAGKPDTAGNAATSGSSAKPGNSDKSGKAPE